MKHRIGIASGMATGPACVLLLAAVALAADWPHWRGPTRDGITPESSGWTAGRWVGQPLWSAALGEGASSPVVAAGRLYGIGHEGGRDVVRCLDAATGKPIWKVAYQAPRYGRVHLGDEGFYAGPCSTPTLDVETGLLYTLSIDGDLHSWNARDGERRWGFNLYERYRAGRRPKVGSGGQQRDYGYTSAPLVYQDWLLVEVGGRDGNLMAFDRRTGKPVWSSPCKDLAGHTGGPARMTVEGVPCAVVLTLTNLVVLRLDRGREGETLATYPWTTDFANNIAAPAVHGDSVLVTSAYNHNAMARLRVTLRGITRVWETPFPSGACTPVVHKGRIYFAWQKVRCLDFATGQPVWEGGFVGDPGSCLVTGDERLIVWGQNGRLLLVETDVRSPRAYRELARLDRVFNTHAWPHVTLAGGRLYCKDRAGNLKCFAVPVAADSR